MPTVTIFGGSHPTEGEKDYEAARFLGRKLADAGFILCNGGYSGVMEATARGAKEAGGRTIGVTTEDFEGTANRWIDQEIRMKKWSERLFKLIELGDGYVVFDGGTGTLVELFVLWEMSNKKFIQKPVIIFGNLLPDLVKQIQKFPHVINSHRLFFRKSAQEVLELLNEKIGKH